ncbi:hypothetical protein I314_02663 [Cryptococcus bacillisporus CA1873]|uniref:feruloyl esterase n=1 Tax=Cryptococcus bacillisporus CA1873 TaxID=1296111 RepID=A0ABR5BC65_CRYGA|nr:hypothetical protein I314_02663 [Cryptococcus bacillisporus CA1873]|eukprot:KIR63882.1 hypothetical protein I314_02663 [Cryptococcus gattii CA1873]
MLALGVLALHILGGFAAPSQLVLNSLVQDAEIKFGLSSEPTKVAKPLTGNIVYELLETERKFLLNVPDNYVHGETHALVFSFHGAGGYSEKQQRITELSDPNLKIAGKPFLTAYAQGVNNTDWNMTHIRGTIRKHNSRRYRIRLRYPSHRILLINNRQISSIRMR